MSITIKQTPLEYKSAHEDNLFVVESDNVTEPNFKYVFDVYISDTLVARVKVFPEPSYNYGVFNASKIIQSYLSPNYFAGGKAVLTPVAQDGFFRLPYVIKFGEEYGSPVTTYTNLETHEPYPAYNYYNGLITYDELVPLNTQNGLDYFGGRFLSVGPLVKKVSMADYSYIYFFNEGGGDDIEETIVVKAYGPSGLTTTVTSDVFTDHLVQVGFGPANINYTWPGTITDTTIYYTIEAGSETMTCILGDCTKFKSYQLVFLNKLGGFDTIPVRMKSTRTMAIERKSFGKSSYRINADGTTSGFESGTSDVIRGTDQVYSVGQKNTFKLTTNNLNEQEFNWLSELVASPLVYLQLSQRNTKSTENQQTGYGVTSRIAESSLSGDVFHFPVKLKTDSYEFKRWHHGVTGLELEAEVLQNYNSQFS